MPRKRTHQLLFGSKSETHYNARSKSMHITAIYFLLGCIWIVFSDEIARFFFTDFNNLLLVSIIKGIFYVLISTLVIYRLVYSSFIKLLDDEALLSQKNEELNVSNINYLGLYQNYAKKQALLKSLINSTEDWIFYIDINGHFLGCNRTFERFTGIDENTLLSLSEEEVQANASLRQLTNIDIPKIINEKTVRYEQSFNYQNQHKVIIEMLFTPYYDQDAVLHGILAVGRDITERKKRENEILYLSYHDTLTGLYNRAYYDVIRKTIDVQTNLPISIIISDVDGLKLINDAFGHTAGDLLLTKTAEILTACCRPSDIITRTGGDEFFVFLPRTSNAEVEAIHQQITEYCEEHKAQSTDSLIFPSISMGFSTKNDWDENINILIKDAEEAMYRRKLLARKGIHGLFLKYITTTIYEKSNETQEHCQRMAKLARELGQLIKLPFKDLDTLELAANLHDIGKISIDLSILQKHDKLNSEEWEILKKHPETGWRIAQTVPELYPIADIVLYHHERWDGQGYPRGLAAQEIPLMSRIIAIVDSFDAMTQERPYQKAMTVRDAIREIQQNAGKQFDPQLAKTFIDDILTKQL